MAMADVKVLLSTGSLYTHPLEKSFYLAARAGFDGVELVANEVYRRAGAADYLKGLSMVSPIVVIHAPFFVEGDSEEKIKSLLVSVELARDLGASKVVFHPPIRFPPELKYLWWFKRTKDFSSIGEDVPLSLEIMPAFLMGRFRINLFSTNTPQQLSEFAKMRGLNITMDTTHTGTWGWDLIETFSLLNSDGLVNHIHLSDFHMGREHVWPKKGCLELEKFVDFLRSSGYKETITLEVSPRELPEDDLEKILAFREVIDWLRGTDNG
jgi:sugar phosphate isomerase/epimerase